VRVRPPKSGRKLPLRNRKTWVATLPGMGDPDQSFRRAVQFFLVATAIFAAVMGLLQTYPDPAPSRAVQLVTQGEWGPGRH
jgi:hypothetical protein